MACAPLDERGNLTSMEEIIPCLFTLVPLHPPPPPHPTWLGVYLHLHRPGLRLRWLVLPSKHGGLLDRCWEPSNRIEPEHREATDLFIFLTGVPRDAIHGRPDNYRDDEKINQRQKLQQVLCRRLIRVDTPCNSTLVVPTVCATTGKVSRGSRLTRDSTLANTSNDSITSLRFSFEYCGTNGTPDECTSFSGS